MNAPSRSALFASTARPSGTRRTGQPVWRCSYDVADPRAKVERPIGDGSPAVVLKFIDSWVRVAEEWADHTRKPGQPHELTGNALKLLRAMMRKCLDFRTGRCEATLERLMQICRFSRPTVVRLLARLRELGFLDWVRRTERTGNKPGEGPLVWQTANAYFFEVGKLPEMARKRLEQLLGAFAPKPCPERVGSGQPPSRGQRMVGALVRGMSGLFAGRGRAEEQRERESLASRIATAQPHEIAAILHPGDAAAQAEYNEMLGLASPQSASCENRPQSPLQNQIQKE